MAAALTGRVGPLARSLVDDLLARAFDPSAHPRHGKGVYMGGISWGGRWRKRFIGEIREALDRWVSGEGETHANPLARFDAGQLRLAARHQGLDDSGDKAALTGRILDDVRARVRARRRANADRPEYSYGTGADRPRVPDSTGRLRDIQIRRSGDRLAVRRLDDNDRPVQGEPDLLFADFAALRAHARKSRLDDLAGWVDKYHPTTGGARRRREARLADTVKRLRGADSWEDAREILYGMDHSEVADLHLHLGGRVEVLPVAPSGRVSQRVLVDAVLAGWPDFRSSGDATGLDLDVAGAAAGSTPEIPDTDIDQSALAAAFGGGPSLDDLFDAVPEDFERGWRRGELSGAELTEHLRLHPHSPLTGRFIKTVTDALIATLTAEAARKSSGRKASKPRADKATPARKATPAKEATPAPRPAKAPAAKAATSPRKAAPAKKTTPAKAARTPAKSRLTLAREIAAAEPDELAARRIRETKGDPFSLRRLAEGHEDYAAKADTDPRVADDLLKVGGASAVRDRARKYREAADRIEREAAGSKAPKTFPERPRLTHSELVQRRVDAGFSTQPTETDVDVALERLSQPELVELSDRLNVSEAGRLYITAGDSQSIKGWPKDKLKRAIREDMLGQSRRTTGSADSGAADIVDGSLDIKPAARTPAPKKATPRKAAASAVPAPRERDFSTATTRSMRERADAIERYIADHPELPMTTSQSPGMLPRDSIETGRQEAARLRAQADSMDAARRDSVLAAEGLEAASRRAAAKAATPPRKAAPVKATPRLAAMSPDEVAAAARDGQVPRATAARHLERMAQSRLEHASYIGLGDREEDMSEDERARLHAAREEATRLRDMAREIRRATPLRPVTSPGHYYFAPMSRWGWVQRARAQGIRVRSDMPAHEIALAVHERSLRDQHAGGDWVEIYGVRYGGAGTDLDVELARLRRDHATRLAEGFGVDPIPAKKTPAAKNTAPAKWSSPEVRRG